MVIYNALLCKKKPRYSVTSHFSRLPKKNRSTRHQHTSTEMRCSLQISHLRSAHSYDVAYVCAWTSVSAALPQPACHSQSQREHTAWEALTWMGHLQSTSTPLGRGGVRCGGPPRRGPSRSRGSARLRRGGVRCGGPRDHRGPLRTELLLLASQRSLHCPSPISLMSVVKCKTTDRNRWFQGVESLLSLVGTPRAPAPHV